MENEEYIARKEIHESAAHLRSTQGINALIEEYDSIKELLAEAAGWDGIGKEEIAELQEERGRLLFAIEQAREAEVRFYEEIEEFSEGRA